MYNEEQATLLNYLHLDTAKLATIMHTLFQLSTPWSWSQAPTLCQTKCLSCPMSKCCSFKIAYHWGIRSLAEQLSCIFLWIGLVCLVLVSTPAEAIRTRLYSDPSFTLSVLVWFPRNQSTTHPFALEFWAVAPHFFSSVRSARAQTFQPMSWVLRSCPNFDGLF